MPNQNSPRPAAGGPQISRRGALSLMGRFQGPELFFSQAASTLTAPIIPRNLKLTRMLHSILIQLKMRVVIATANIATPAAESPQNYLQRVRLTGTHRLYNQLIPIDLQGSTAFVLSR